MFFIKVKIDHSLVLEELFDRYYMTVRVTSSGIKEHSSHKEMEKILNDLQMILVKHTESVPLNKGKILLEKKLLQGFLKIIQIDNVNYLYFENEYGHFILRDIKKQNSFHWSSYLILAIIISILILSYISLYKSLYPLKELQDKVRLWGNGNENIDFQSNSKNEIGDLSNEFNFAILKIQKLTQSRILFLRNIMHELKTPIAKGRFSVELITDKTPKDQLIKVFTRMDIILAELASIEMLSSGNYQLLKKNYRFLDILDHCFDILFTDSDQFTLEVDDDFINVDFKLFSIAVKNLIDNGMKYSTDHKVLIYKQNNLIQFSNRGEKIKQLTEGAIQDEFLFNQKDPVGSGFGLNIVSYILNIHGFTMSYQFDKGVNIISIHIKH